MLKTLQARLQPSMNRELPDIPAGFRKGRGTGDQAANIHWIIKKAIEFQKNIDFCFINFQIFQLVLEKAEELEIKLPTSIGSSRKR